MRVPTIFLYAFALVMTVDAKVISSPCNGCWECAPPDYCVRALEEFEQTGTLEIGELLPGDYDGTDDRARRMNPDYGKGSKKGSSASKSAKKGKSSKKRMLCDMMDGGDEIHYVTRDYCCGGPLRRLELKIKEGRMDDPPWLRPNTPEATLLANNPGIWKIPGFLDDYLVERLLHSLSEQEDDGTTERFEGCVGESHEHLERKKCFRLSTNTARDIDERALVEELLVRLNEVWPNEAEQRDYMYVQRTKAGCGMTEVHKDVQETDFKRLATATVVFYLTDGGAGVFFPYLNITIPPERGMAITWLNVHLDGSFNNWAAHGIQATPDGIPDRISLSFRITLPQHVAPLLEE